MHARNMRARCPSIELVAVVDSDAGRARSMGQELGVAWSSSFGDLLGDPATEGVVIATPTSLHAGMIETAAKAAKHVFCEKPIALDYEASAAAVCAARTAGIKLQIGFHRRFDPDWVSAAARIASGELGDVYLFRTSLRDKAAPSPEFLASSGGFFVDVTIHDLDTARWMVGEIDEVTAVGATLSSDELAAAGEIDNAVVTLRFAGGAIGVIDNSRVAGYGYECSTEVMGSRATVRIANHRRVHTEWLTPGAASVDFVTNFVERYPEAYARELQGFAEAIARDREPEATGEDGLAAFVLAAACERSFQEGRPVRLRRVEHAARPSYEPTGVVP
jgi:predicted dehydrogenase